VVSVAYCLRVIKLMYFDPPADLPATERHVGVRSALALNAAALIALGVFPHSLLSLCEQVLS